MSPLDLRLVGDIICAVLCIAAMGFDLKSQRIPNFLTLPGLGIGLAIAVYGGAYDFAGAAMAVVLLGGVLALFAAAGGIGWGDVKLMAAVGALLGWPLVSWPIVLYALLYTAICGGLLALIVSAWRRRLGAALKAVVTIPRRGREKKSSGVTIPYGVAIGFGTLWAIGSRYIPALLIG